MEKLKTEILELIFPDEFHDDIEISEENETVDIIVRRSLPFSIIKELNHFAEIKSLKLRISPLESKYRAASVLYILYK